MAAGNPIHPRCRQRSYGHLSDQTAGRFHTVQHTALERMQRTSRLQASRKKQLMVLMRILITFLLLALCSCDLDTIFFGELLCRSGISVHASADTDSLYVEIVAGDSLIYSKKDTSKYFSWGIDNRDLENFNWTINITSYRQPDSTNTETYQFFIKRHSNSEIFVGYDNKICEDCPPFVQIQYDNFCDD